MAYKCKISDAVNLRLYETCADMCTFSKAIGIYTENKIYLPNEEYINGHL